MNRLIVCVCAIVLLGCKQSAFKIESNKVDYIKIVAVGSSDTIKLQDRNQIRQIVSCLNRNKQEPVKFLPKYRIEIIFKDESFTFTINSNYVSGKGGVKYILNCDLENVLLTTNNSQK